MSNEEATALTDFILAAGTFYFAFTVGPRKSQRAWSTLFLAMGMAALFGGIFHGIPAFHTPPIWTLVAGFTVASGFLFLSCCISLFRPNWNILHWLWPVFGVLGLLLGLVMAELPFSILSIPNGICLALGAWILKRAPEPMARKWIYRGLIAIVIGLVMQIIVPFEGLLYKNAVFHYFQLAGNFMLWRGARSS